MPAPTKDDQISIRLPNALKTDVAAYAELTGRSTSHVAMEALQDYLDWRAPQVEDLKKAIAEADRGRFATDEEVRAVVDRYATTSAAAKAKAPRRR